MSHITVLTPTVEGLDSGDPNLSLPGTGLAIPWGIDAVFYYNGLTFNNRTTIDKIRITSIEGLDDPDVRDTREDNVAEDGETPYDAHHGGRTLVFNGKIEAFQRFKLRDLQEAIKSAFVDLTEHPLFFLTGNPTLDHYIDCRKSSKIQWTEEQKDAGTYYRDFQLTLRASNPRFLKYQAHSQGMDPDSTRSLPISNFGNYTSEPIIIISGGMTDIEFNLE